MTISMPSSPNFRSSRFGLETNTQRFESPVTRTSQRLALSGARWLLTFTLPKMNRAQAAPWQSFLLQLEGSANTFYGFDPDAKTPRGAATGTPLVNGGSQTGSSLITDGWPNSTLVLRVGDYFSVNGELKMVTSDVTSDGSGNGTISFKPALRDSPANNAALTVTNATCNMVLVDDQQAVWSTDANGFYEEMTISAVEAIIA